MRQVVLGMVLLCGCALQGARGELSNGVGVTADEEVPLPGEVEAEGTLAEVDASAGTIVIERDGERLTLKAGRDTAVFAEGRLGTLEALEPGEEIRASYDERTGTLRWLEDPRDLGADGKLLVQPAEENTAEVKE